MTKEQIAVKTAEELRESKENLIGNVPEEDIDNLVIRLISEVYSENDFEGKPITTEIIAQLMVACIKKGLMYKVQI